MPLKEVVSLKPPEKMPVSFKKSLQFGDCRSCDKLDAVIWDGNCASCLAGVTCPNYILCKRITPTCVMKISNLDRYCSRCDGVFYKTPFHRTTLEFKPPDPQEPCSVCMSSETTMMKFPIKGCSHWFCVECSRNLIFWDESRTDIDARPYGCPPCPNGCDNPTVGRQCYCEEYDSVRASWGTRAPDQYRQWEEAESYSYYHTETGFGTGKCPLCRKYISDSA